MSDDRPDEGEPTDPRPSGRIRIVGAQPATGEHPAVAVQGLAEEPGVEVVDRGGGQGVERRGQRAHGRRHDPR